MKLLSTLLLAMLPGVCTPCQAAVELSELKTHSQVVSSADQEYVVDVEGALNPENVEIKLEVLGGVSAVNPRITINGLYDWYDVDSMVSEATRSCTTDEEKALAIWEWVHWKRFQRLTADDSALNPVRALNGYGYGICGNTASWIRALCRAAGIEARVYEVTGHTISEIYYENAWHMLDGNAKVFYLARDNRTIASVADLEKDPWLIERTIHPQDPWIRGLDRPIRNQRYQRYLRTDRDNWINTGYDFENAKDYNMGITLRPGETLTRWWRPELRKFASPQRIAQVPKKYANGQLVWQPDPNEVDLLDFLRIESRSNVSSQARDGRDPAVHVDYFHSEDYERPSRWDIPVHSPYPILGVRLWTGITRTDIGRDRMTINFAGPGWDIGSEVYNWRWEGGVKEIELDLDAAAQAMSPLYGYHLIYQAASAENEEEVRSGMNWFKVVTDLQVAPHSLPALLKGRNVVRYCDESEYGRKVRITFKYRTRHGNRPPGAVGNAISPSEQITLTPVLEWQPAEDPDAADLVADYQVMLSLRSDCRWPLSPSTFRNVGSADCMWAVPASFLLPNSTYYWKVRCRDGHGEIGPWSKVFSFRTTVDAE